MKNRIQPKAMQLLEWFEKDQFERLLICEQLYDGTTSQIFARIIKKLVFVGSATRVSFFTTGVITNQDGSLN